VLGKVAAGLKKTNKNNKLDVFRLQLRLESTLEQLLH